MVRDNPSDPPRYVVVFASTRTRNDGEGYDDMARRVMELASRQEGFLGVESVREAGGEGVTVSYWASEEAIARWKADLTHREAQAAGMARWYSRFRLTVARIERDTTWSAS